MSNEAFEKWAAKNAHNIEKYSTGRYRYTSTEDVFEAWQAGRNAALTEAEKTCNAVCSERVNEWDDGYNQGALICRAEIRRLRAA